MNNLTTEQNKELDTWYKLYTVTHKARPTWNELVAKANEILEKGVDK